MSSPKVTTMPKALLSLIESNIAKTVDDSYHTNFNPNDSSWREQASCSEISPEIFFPDHESFLSSDRSDAYYAKMVCNDCEVRVRCLNFALHNREQYGIWGGLTPRQRRKYLEQLANKKTTKE